jgi:NAD-dependent deacetylase sirtuin 5
MKYMDKILKFQELFSKSKNIAILTGAGISSESGIPTFRGIDGLWRKFDVKKLATLEAFNKNPLLIWEFYHYRRELISKNKPNKTHFVLVELEKKCKKENKKFSLITQNIDGFHTLAGSENVLEMHGNIWETRCTQCKDIIINKEIPICPALRGKGDPSLDFFDSNIPIKNLPHCKKCNGLLRPNVVWFNESLNPVIMNKINNILENCDFFLVIGTSSTVYPAARFIPQVNNRKIPIIEINTEITPNSSYCTLTFQEKASIILPKLLQIEIIEYNK